MAVYIEQYIEFNPGVNGDWRSLRKIILPELPHTPTQIRIDGYVFDVLDIIYDVETNDTILYTEDSPRTDPYETDDTRLTFVNDLISKGWTETTEWKQTENLPGVIYKKENPMTQELLDAVAEANNIARSFGASGIRLV